MFNPQQKTNASKKVIFNAQAAVQHLRAVRAAANEEPLWWSGVFHQDWGSTRKGSNGTQWVNFSYTDVSGVTGRTIVRVKGERHYGRIMPATDAGIAELAAQMPNAKTLEKRTKKVVFQGQKWNKRVNTEEDGITLLADSDGQPILPGDEHLSAYYEFAYYMNEAFTFEAKERVDRGMALVAKVVEVKRADKTAAAAAVIDAFAASNGPRRAGDMILSSEGVSTIRKHFPAQKDIDALVKGAIITANVKITNLVQEYISDQAKRNAGLPLPNPITRFTLGFNPTTGIAEMAFYDKNAPYMAEGRQKYEVAKVNGEPINADNVHLFILPGSIFDGVVNLNAICLSNMGISIPAKAEICVITNSSWEGINLEDVYDDEDDGCAAPIAAAKNCNAAPIAAAAAPIAAVPEVDYSDLLGELNGGV